MAEGVSDSSTGPATNRFNNPVEDPTANVLGLVEAAIKRQDDLRESDSRHLREIMVMRGEYQHELRRAETDRIDAIRAVDVGAVNRAAEVAAVQAATLASQVATSAETLRTQVAATAQAGATALAAALEPIRKDIADLRQVQYETAGGKAQTTEQREIGGAQSTWIGVAIAGLGLLLALAIYLSTNKQTTGLSNVGVACPVGYVCTPRAPITSP